MSRRTVPGLSIALLCVACASGGGGGAGARPKDSAGGGGGGAAGGAGSGGEAGEAGGRATASPRPAAAGPWPTDWSLLLGEKVTVEGKALDAKAGALLAGEGGEIWIDGLDGWPGGLYLGGDRGRRVRVTGVVIERADLPVVVEDPGEPRRAGIPVPPGTDVEKARRRYLLGDATWEVIGE